MKISTLLITVFASLALISKAQQAYEIKVNFIGSTDTTYYLAKYYFGQTFIVDSAKRVKNGLGVFKGSEKLDRGIYVITNQKRERYIDFMVNEKQKFTLIADVNNIAISLKSPDSKENEDLAAYSNFFSTKNNEMQKDLQKSKGMSKVDSMKLVQETQAKYNALLQKYDDDFMAKHKGTFIYDFLYMRTEKVAVNVPTASNGRPDSVYQYYYYKNHFFDGVDFKDDRILFTPFLADRINKYFDNIIVQHPDTVIVELFKVINACTPNSLVYNRLLGHFMYKYETNKTMTFDKFGTSNTFEKVFVALADAYVIPGKATELYDESTVEKIKTKVNITRNLLPEVKISDLNVLDTTMGPRIIKLGFDTVSSSKSATDLYAKHATKITPYYKTLYDVKAKYTVLVFWSVDCGHCQTEIPELNEKLKTLKGKVDCKVFAVQTKNELYDKWRRFIIEHKLDFINVIDGVHINNLTERFDINRTPVIYILDKDKKIKAKNVTSDQVVDILKNMETPIGTTN
jgi:thiol-disulfide isomerase/thioredoxin